MDNDKRGALHAKAGEILARAKGEGRDLTTQEAEMVDLAHDVLRSASTGVIAGRQDTLPEGEAADARPGNGAAQLRALVPWFLAGAGRRIGARQRLLDDAEIDPHSNIAHITLATDTERRALLERRAQSTTTTAGGYTVPNDPMQALEEAMLQYGSMRQVAWVLRTASGANLPIPTVDDTSNKGSILSENTQTTTETDFVYGQVVLAAFKYSSDIVRASLEFLQDTSINAESFIARNLGIRLGRITNDHFTFGSNSSQPYGVQWAATKGKTAASATALAYTDLVDLLHSVDPAYRVGPSVAWMFNDSTLGTIQKIADNYGHPVFQQDPRGTGPATILGHPYVINQSMSNVAAGVHSVLFGDFSKYAIRDVMDVMVIRMAERYIDYGQIGFLAFSRHDGDLIDAGTHPIKYLLHPAS